MRTSFRELRVFRNQDYNQLEDVVADWLAQTEQEIPSEACIAVAAAPAAADARIRMINIDWEFSCSDLSSQFNISKVHWVNDFFAIAYALPFLCDSDRQLLFPGNGTGGGKLAVVGPGTGLGGATTQLIDKKIQVSSAEPGYMGLSPDNDMELELFKLLLSRHDSIYAELLLSGPGLQHIHEAICEIQDRPCEALDASQISERAQHGSDSCCQTTLNLFCALLGSVCGDFVLANGAYKGLYLAGGILPRMAGFLGTSQFHSRFCAKGAMSGHMRSMPVYMITTGQPGLIGAAHIAL